MPTIGGLDDATQEQIDAVDTVAPVENGAGNATVKGTVLQWLKSMLRPSLLTAGVTAEVTAAAKWLVEDSGMAVPYNRYLTLAQMVALMNARTGRILKLQPIAKVGATAGWVVGGGAVNTGKIATLIAGQAGATLVIPIAGLMVGDIITRLTLNGSIQSAGNASTLIWDLRKLTNAAAGGTDASVIALAAAVNVAVSTKVDVANGSRAAINYTVTADESLYLLVTSTTAAATTQEIDSIDITRTEA